MQPCLTPLPILNHSIIPAVDLTAYCCFLYKLRIRSIMWGGKPISIMLIQSWLCDTIECLFVVYETHVQWLAKFPGFLGDKPQIYYLISCSTSSSESGLHIRNLFVDMILDPGHNDRQENFTCMWYQWHSPVIAADWQISLLWRGDEYRFVQSNGHSPVSQTSR